MRIQLHLHEIYSSKSFGDIVDSIYYNSLAFGGMQDFEQIGGDILKWQDIVFYGLVPLCCALFWLFQGIAQL